MSECKEVIETCQDMLDVLNTNGSAYLYRHNGGDRKLKIIINCLEENADLKRQVEDLKQENKGLVQQQTALMLEEIKDKTPLVNEIKEYQQQLTVMRGALEEIGDICNTSFLLRNKQKAIYEVVLTALEGK